MKETWGHLSRPLSNPIAIKQAQLSPAHEINAQQTPTPIPGSKTQSLFNHLPGYLILSSPTSFFFGPAPLKTVPLMLLLSAICLLCPLVSYVYVSRV